MSRGHRIGRRALIALLAMACVAASASGTSARGYKFRVLYSFCTQANCADGSEPLASLVMDQAGNLYGTTAAGGSQNDGTVFELTPGATKKWRYKTLYTFCSQADCTDGTEPTSSLIIDTSGNLYGTASGGGQNDGGVVFRLHPKAKGGTYDVLHAFCAGGAPCQDGFTPKSGLTYAGASSGTPYDGTSPLFGVTTFGGASADTPGWGVLYRLVPHGANFAEKTLYSFCSKRNCKDGGDPWATPLSDAQGHLFGTLTTGGGNAAHEGGIFEWDTTQETMIYSFCNQQHCADGYSSVAPLIFDASHNLFGTALDGGANNHGVLFFFDGAESVLYNFCTVTDSGVCIDGEEPMAGLVLDASGSLFGTTSGGGTQFGGVVFRYNDGETVLHNFCSQPNCADGNGPAAGLIMDAAGNLYGTTQAGGAAGGGTVFELSPN